MTKFYYKQMVHDHLHDTDTYEVLSEDLDHDNIVMEMLQEFAEKYEILSAKEVKYISDFHTILQTFTAFQTSIKVNNPRI